MVAHQAIIVPVLVMVMSAHGRHSTLRGRFDPEELEPCALAVGLCAVSVGAGCLELALDAVADGEAAEQKLHALVKAGTVEGYTDSEQLDRAVEAGEFSADDADTLRRFWALRRRCIMVDDFPHDVGRNERKETTTQRAEVAALDGTYSG